LTRTEAEGIVREYRKEAASQIGGWRAGNWQYAGLVEEQEEFSLMVC
jgi:hypothetical protein